MFTLVINTMFIDYIYILLFSLTISTYITILVFIQYFSIYLCTFLAFTLFLHLGEITLLSFVCFRPFGISFMASLMEKYINIWKTSTLKKKTLVKKEKFTCLVEDKIENLLFKEEVK